MSPPILDAVCCNICISFSYLAFCVPLPLVLAVMPHAIHFIAVLYVILALAAAITAAIKNTFLTIVWVAWV